MLKYSVNLVVRSWLDRFLMDDSSGIDRQNYFIVSNKMLLSSSAHWSKPIKDAIEKAAGTNILKTNGKSVKYVLIFKNTKKDLIKKVFQRYDEFKDSDIIEFTLADSIPLNGKAKHFYAIVYEFDID